MPDEALALGVVDEVVAPEAVLDAAIGRARSYGENPTPQVRVDQAAADAERERDRPRAWCSGARSRRVAEAYTTPEHKEAVAAFLGRGASGSAS